MFRELIGAVVGLTLTGMVTGVQGAILIPDPCGDPCNPKGFTDLRVGDRIYDIDFVYGTWDQSFPTNSVFSDAEKIALATVEALNLFGAGEIYPTGSAKFLEFIVPLQYKPADNTLLYYFWGSCTFNCGEWLIRPRGTLSDVQRDTPFNYAVPTLKAVVPIPAALPLFASALGVMGFFGWRRRRS